MTRRLMVLSAIAVVGTAALLPGSGFGSSTAPASGAQSVPANLAAAIHARFGAGAIRSSGAVRAEQPGPGLGASVALSSDGTTALVGAPGVAHSTGGAYIFHASDAGSWTSTDTPTASLMNKAGPANDQLFGYSVALSADGTTAFVGAPLAGSGLGGAIYVFHASAENAWASSSTPAATLTVSNAQFVGISLAGSPDGTTLVAGAPSLKAFAGGAYIFHASSESAWATTSTPTATLSNKLESQNDAEVGFAVAISGDGTTSLVGDGKNPGGGGAYLYHVLAAASWTDISTPTAILTDSNITGLGALGAAVALSGDGTVALLGASAVSANKGAADVFHASSQAAWATTSTPTATLSGGPAHGFFGARVAMAPDGTNALVTAPGANGVRGAAYIFHVAGEGAWVSSSAPTATLTDSGGHSKDALGAVSAFSGDGATALIGAPGVLFETGAADVFHVADATSWATNSTPTAILTDSALDQCVVPSLKKLTVAKAKAALKVRSCRLGKVRRVVQPKTKKGRVVSQSQTPGSRLPVGTKIAIKIEK